MKFRCNLIYYNIIWRKSAISSLLALHLLELTSCSLDILQWYFDFATILSFGSTDVQALPLYVPYGIWPCPAAGQGMVFYLSVLNRVYNLVWVCPKQGMQARIHTGFHPFTEILQKSVTFFQVEILSEWLGNPGKGILRCQNPKNVLRAPAPWNRLEACAFGPRLGNRSVFILGPRLVVCNFLSVNRVLPARLIWFARWILFVLQVYKNNDYNVHFRYCNCR